MVQLDKDLLTWLKDRFYIEAEVDSLLAGKSDTSHTHTIDSELDESSSNPVKNSVITTELAAKAPANHADSSNTYGIGTDSKYGHLKLDSSIKQNGANPVTGGAIYTGLSGKSDTEHTHTSLNSTLISSGNLNSYKTVGEYYCDNDTNAGTLSNCPVSEAFHLSVIKHSGVRQILKTRNTSNVLTYERNFHNNTWSSWKVTYNPDSLGTADSDTDGLMSSSDYTKLSGIDQGANKITVDTTITSNGTNPVTGKAIYTALNGKANKNHASTGTDYGLATTSNYGHTKVINNLEKNEYANGEALSAYQGKLLKDNVDSKASNNHTHTGSELRLGSSGSDANVTIQEAINSKSPEAHDSTNNTYGLGTTSKYGHVKIINNLEKTSYTDGEALSAYQGNVLNNNINAKAPTNHSSTATTYGVATATNYGHTKVINSLDKSSFTNGEALSAYQGKVLKDAVDGKASSSHTHYNLVVKEVIEPTTEKPLDLNNYTSVGIYTLAKAKNKVELMSNTPIFNYALYIENKEYSNGNIIQIARTVSTNKQNNRLFYRVYTSNNWATNGEWKEVITDANVINDLTSTSTVNALSAAQGKELKRLVDTKWNSTPTSLLGQTVDLDTITTPGSYLIYDADVTASSHTPRGNGRGVFLTVQIIPSGILQIATDYYGDPLEIFYRYQRSDSWRPWRKLHNSKEPTITTYTTLLNGWSGKVRIAVKNGWAIITGIDVKCSSTSSGFNQIVSSDIVNQLNENIYATGTPSSNYDSNLFRVNEDGVLQGRCLVADEKSEFTIMVPVQE